jgi:hypothetical protein
MEEMRNAYKILIGKCKAKRPLGRPRHKWVDNVRMDLKEIVWEVVNWIHLADNKNQWRII